MRRDLSFLRQIAAFAIVAGVLIVGVTFAILFVRG